MLYHQMSVDQKFEHRQFSLLQYRNLFYLCMQSRIFESFRDLASVLKNTNSQLAKDLTYWIFQYEYFESDF
jgi:hypothetical protein